MSVLLGQTDGFEGLTSIQVLPEPNRLSVSNGPHMRHLGLNIRAASSRPPAVKQEHEELISDVDVLLHLNREVVKEFKGLFPVSPDRLMATVNTRFRYFRWVVGFDAGVHQFEDGIEIPASNRRVAFPSNLHVLLRHRLLREACSFAFDDRLDQTPTAVPVVKR